MIQMHRSRPSHSRHQPPACARGRTGPTGRTGSLPSASPTPAQAPTGLFGALPSVDPAHSQTGPPFLGLGRPPAPHHVPGPSSPRSAARPLITGGKTGRQLRRLSLVRALPPSVSLHLGAHAGVLAVVCECLMTLGEGLGGLGAGSHAPAREADSSLHLGVFCTCAQRPEPRSGLRASRLLQTPTVCVCVCAGHVPGPRNSERRVNILMLVSPGFRVSVCLGYLWSEVCGSASASPVWSGARHPSPPHPRLQGRFTSGGGTQR